MITEDLKYITRKDINSAGGKAVILGELMKKKFSVPEGFVILTDAFEKFLEETDTIIETKTMWDKINIKDIESIEENSEIVRSVILKKKFPEKLGEEILAAFDKLGQEYVAIRSSATAEDSEVDTWAGQLESYLFINRSNFLESIKQCWASLYTPRALFYRKERNLHRKQISIAVVVQKMISSEVSGVCFTVHPITQNKNQMIIEACFGLGEALVQGTITPDSYVVKKNDLSFIDININKQEKFVLGGKKGTYTKVLSESKGGKQKLTKSQIKDLAKVCLQIEKRLIKPQDIEWAFEKGKFYIIQSRNITTLL